MDLWHDLGVEDVDDESCYEHEIVVTPFDAATGDGLDMKAQMVVEVVSDLGRKNLNHLMVCCCSQRLASEVLEPSSAFDSLCFDQPRNRIE